MQQQLAGPAERRVFAALSYAAHGDRDALCYLYCRFAEDVFASILPMTNDAPAAEELTRSLFADLPQAIADYDPRLDGPFPDWLLEVARESTVDRRRPA